MMTYQTNIKRYFPVFLIFTFLYNAQAQNLNWAKAIGCLTNDIYVDNARNIFLTGSFSRITDFDLSTKTYQLTPKGSDDIYVAKYTSDGILIWVKSFGGLREESGKKIKVDNVGNIYISGNFSGPVDFDPGPDSCLLTPFLRDNQFITKLDSSGKFVWARQFDYSDNFKISSFGFDSSDHIYFTGYYSGQADFDPDTGIVRLTSNGILGFQDAFVLKLNSSGKYIWVKSIGGGKSDEGSSLVLNESGGVYVVGTFVGTVDFDPGIDTFNLTASAGKLYVDNSPFILKLNYSGSFEWAKKFDTKGSTQSNLVALDNNGNPFVVGLYVGKGDFDPDSGTFYLKSKESSNWPDIYTCKLTESGSFVWAKSMSGNSYKKISAISLDKAGNIYMAGDFRDSVDFDPSINQTNLVAPHDFNGYYTNGYILKLNNIGNLTWVKQYGVKSIVNFYSLILDTFGSIYSIGTFMDSVDFDPGLGKFHLTIGEGFIFKISDCNIPKAPTLIKWVDQVCAGSKTTYAVDSIAGVDSYLWEVPNGSTITSGQSTKTIEVLFGNNSGNIILSSINKCGYSYPTELGITVKSLPNLTIKVIPSTIVCSGTNVILTGQGALDYKWSLGVRDGVAFNIQSSNTFTVTGTDKFGCVNINSISIRVTPTPHFTAAVSNQFVSSGSDAIFEANNLNNSAQYQWQINAGLGFLNMENYGPFYGVNTKKMTIKNVNSGYDNYGFRCISKIEDCSDTTNIALLNVKSLAQKNISRESHFQIYPNPCKDNFVIMVDDFSSETDVEIFNALGQIIYKTNFIERKIKLEPDLEDGIYYIRLRNKYESFYERLFVTK